MNLDGKKVLVSGGTSGLGLALANKLQSAELWCTCVVEAYLGKRSQDSSITFVM
jgi:short-subunit dehydrogenase involved in D-alanine esterification of teichoic acids